MLGILGAVSIPEDELPAELLQRRENIVCLV